MGIDILPRHVVKNIIFDHRNRNISEIDTHRGGNSRQGWVTDKGIVNNGQPVGSGVGIDTSISLDNVIADGNVGCTLHHETFAQMQSFALLLGNNLKYIAE